MSLCDLRMLPEQSRLDELAAAAGRQFIRVTGMWIGVALVLGYLALNVQISTWAFHEAYKRNAAEHKLAEDMWRDFCTAPTWQHMDDDALKSRLLQYGHDCDWAQRVKSWDVMAHSIMDAERPYLINFAKHFGGVLEPRLLLSVLGFAHMCMIVAPVTAFVTLYKATRLRSEMLRKLQDYKPTLAERLSLGNIIDSDRKRD